MSGMDAFEQKIRDVLEPFEVPYNSADWSQMERMLDGQKRGVRAGRSAWGIALLLIMGATAGIWAWQSDNKGPADGPTSMAETRSQGENPSPARVQDASPAPTQPGSEGTMDTSDHQEATSTNPERGTGFQGIHRTEGRTATSEVSRPGGPVSEQRSSDPVPPTEEDPTPEAEATMAIRPSITEGCPGTTVEFSAENLPDEGIFLWNFGDGSFSNKSNPSHTYSKSGRFEVMLSHSSMGGGNIRNKPSSDLIVINEAPEADFVAQAQNFDGQLPSVHFENRTVGGRSYQWDFGDGVTSDVAHPDHIFRRKGTYKVELVVTNASGCVDRKEREVVVAHDYNLLAPEAFSPNGDGTNDLFIPEALRDLDLRFKLAIYDRSNGELVYETTDATKPWTGRRMNRGELCKPDTYVWVVEFPDALHLSDTPFQGEVTLVR